MPRRLPVLDDSTQAGVNSLATMEPAAGVASLAEYAIEYLKAAKTTDSKALYAAAGRLGLSDPAAFETALLSVCNLYWEAAKARLQEKELGRAMVQFTALSDQLKDQLVQVYVQSRKELLRLIAKLRGSLPHYHDLDWRIDVELGRRSRLHEPRPLYLLRLDTSTTTACRDNDGDGGGGRADGEEEEEEEEGLTIKSYHLQSDYANLKKLLTSLNAAVAEVSSTHCQRFARYIR